MAKLKNEKPAGRYIPGVAVFEGGETREVPDEIATKFDGLPGWKVEKPKTKKYSPFTSEKKKDENNEED